MQQTHGAHALEYADFWRRFAAFVTDALILGIALRILFPFGALGFTFWDIGNSWFFIPILAVSYLFSILVVVAYSVTFWTLRGQTPGMMILGMKVLRGDGTSVTLGYALLRYLGYIICTLMLGTGFLWIVFDPRKQGIHDKIADTVVVKLPRPTRTHTALATPHPT
jgi:uncharacterized RDD family membrane protein YckC